MEEEGGLLESDQGQEDTERDLISQTDRIVGDLRNSGLSTDQILECLDIVAVLESDVVKGEEVDHQKEEVSRSVSRAAITAKAAGDAQLIEQAIEYGVFALLKNGVGEDQFTPEAFRQIQEELDNVDSGELDRKVQELLEKAGITREEAKKLAGELDDEAVEKALRDLEVFKQKRDEALLRKRQGL